MTHIRAIFPEIPTNFPACLLQSLEGFPIHIERKNIHLREFQVLQLRYRIFFIKRNKYLINLKLLSLMKNLQTQSGRTWNSLLRDILS